MQMLPSRVLNVKVKNDIVAWSALFVGLGTLTAVIYQSFIYTQQLKVFDGQLKVAQDQEQKQLRAYTGSFNASIIGFVPPATYTISNNISSFGQTPAYGIDIVWNSRSEFHHDNNVYPTDLTTSISDKSNQTLYPGSNKDWSHIITIIPDHQENFKNNIMVIRYYGNITYSDVFGNLNISHFCYFFDQNIINQFVSQKSKPVILYRCNSFNDGK